MRLGDGAAADLINRTNTTKIIAASAYSMADSSYFHYILSNTAMHYPALPSTNQRLANNSPHHVWQARCLRHGAAVDLHIGAFQHDGLDLRVGAPPSTVQLNLAEAAARQAVDMGERLEEKAWLGRRPTLPDSRPIIGAMPGHRNLWLAFGHQHIGFSTGPGTGLMLAALMSGEASPIDATPFRAERFLKG